jgi:hypothetical protein
MSEFHAAIGVSLLDDFRWRRSSPPGCGEAPQKGAWRITVHGIKTTKVPLRIFVFPAGKHFRTSSGAFAEP